MAVVATVAEITARFSIVTPVYNPPLGAFLACAASVRAQTRADWEWCLVDDCSTRPEVVDAVAALAAVEPRIRVHHRAVNGGIVAATNDALAMARGDFVALLDHDDALVPTALADVAAMLDTPDGDRIDYLYTDEAHVLTDGRETAHFLKPDWSPERFRASMYTCHLSVLRRSVVAEIGGFRTGFDGAQDHDLILRATEQITAAGRRVAHLPRLAYHWRNVSSSVSRASDTLDTAIQRGLQAVQEQCDRLGIDARVVHGDVDGCYRLVRRVAPSMPVTVVVATAGEVAACRPYRLAAAATMREVATTHPATRLVFAHPADLSPAVLELLAEAGGERWQPVPVAGPWSIAVALDRAVQTYPGAVLVSIAPGLVPRSDVTPDWLETLAGLAMQPGVGLAGGLVASTEDVVVHAGWDVPNYRWYELEGLRVGTTSSGNDLFIERECSQVTLGAAAIALPHWHELKHSAAAATDWDAAGRALSDALTASGLSTIWTPWSRFDQRVPIT
ncbi:MAG: putative glycosyltransferase [Ilumatobacteraceae bacterium]|nr:putative glycosyltransferase [Ilumatobacteraceae bacterium]